MNDQPPGPCELLDWDSDFFGFGIARLRDTTLTPDLAREADVWCRAEGVSCLYFLAEVADPVTTIAAEDAGFRLVDVSITRVRTIVPSKEPPAPPPKRFRISIAEPEHLEGLKALARVSHRTTRFYYDGGFPRHLCDEMYARWITRAFEEPDQTLLVAELDGGPVGYASYSLRAGTGTQGLLAIADEVKGSRIGPALVRHVIERVANEGGTRLIGATQARNTAIQRFLERLEFRFRGAQLWYHKWYAAPDAGGPPGG